MRTWLIALCTALLLISTASRADAEQEAVGFAGADYWHAVKHGQEGVTTSRSAEHQVLISVPSQLWFEVKTKWVSPLGAIAIFGSIALCGLMYWVVGPTKLSKPRTGRKLKRWSRVDRALHWITAAMFLTLAGSGLAIIYGKYFIKPVVSIGVWQNWIWFAKAFHNYVGPLFFFCLVAVLIKWFKYSVVNMVDVRWFMKAGGMMGPHKGSHPSSGFSNGGEKAIFWLLIWFGGAVVLTGMFLNFPIFGQLRSQMAWASFVHIVCALVLMCGFIFHIYMGLFQMEGALEGMITGEVDETWAKEHHDLWFAEVKHQLDEPKDQQPPR